MPDCTLREQLNKNRALHRQLMHDLERREFLETKATRLNAPLVQDKVKTSPEDRTTIMLAALADLDTIIDAERKRFEGLAAWSRSFFEDADLEHEELEVMIRRYIDCLDWEEIAELMFWSKRTVQRLHGKALEKLGRHWHALSREKCDIV